MLTPRKKRPGRPVDLAKPERDALVELATSDAEHRRKTMLDIAIELGYATSRKAVRNAFATEGYNRCIARKKPFLTPAAK